jgi:hydroxypyruvate reductase
VTLRRDAQTIWHAGVAAVNSTKLVQNAIRQDQNAIVVSDETFIVERLRRIVVVGAGKAGAGMAAGVETALGEELVDSKVVGWINVPEDCVRPLRRIHLHPARPAAVNEPTAAGVFGSNQILDLVSTLTNDDLCLVLISGGGSALLPAPSIGISLEDKLGVTRFLMRSGATIQELNTVRKRLSRIKGGGLLRAAKAGHFISLIISDVPGDPIDIIASAPALCDNGTAKDAIDVLERFAGQPDPQQLIPNSVWRSLKDQANTTTLESTHTIPCSNHIIGNNMTALSAAANEAKKLGYEVRLLGTNRQGIAKEVGVELAELSLVARNESQSRAICYLAGGEPVVKLSSTNKPRRGGRNQEVALSAACRLMHEDASRLVVLSGGTDGEDGPTDAAGAVFDESIQKRTKSQGLNAEEFLEINDSYTFFDQVGGLLKTGPTNTNVMDLQIALIAGA